MTKSFIKGAVCFAAFGLLAQAGAGELPAAKGRPSLAGELPVQKGKPSTGVPPMMPKMPIKPLQCADLDQSLDNVRKALRMATVSKIKSAEVREDVLAQVLSSLISAKLADPKISEKERANLQQEHEGACSDFN